MKKFLSLSLAMILMLSSATTVLAQESKSDNDYLSDSDYNNVYQQSEDDTLLSLDNYNQVYANESVAKQQSEDDTLLSLDNYNQVYANETIPEQQSDNTTKDSRVLSEVKTQTKSINMFTNNASVGTVTLQYQTEIVGGRPQFQYTTCYLGNNITTYWNLDYSHVDFSGDSISVYYLFSYGDFTDYAWVHFYP